MKSAPFPDFAIQKTVPNKILPTEADPWQTFPWALARHSLHDSTGEAGF
jgi:hypothetical protein